MKKWYRIFEVKGDNSIGEAINSKANWFEAMEEAEISLKEIVVETYSTYTILPIYEA